MGTAIVTKSNIESAPHGNVFAIINNRNNINDPREKTRGTTGQTFVYDSDPFIKAINFEDFPYVVVNFPKPTYSNHSMNGKVKKIVWSQEIIVRAAKDGAANNNSDIGKSDVFSIGDDLHETFNSDTIKQQLRDLNMFSLNNEPMLVKEDSEPIRVEEKPVYEEIYRLTYYTRLTVSD